MVFKGMRRHGQFRFLIIDIVMVVLLAVNLTWIIFDWLFAYDALRGLLAQVLPGFVSWYARVIHGNFILIDLGFVAIFLTDFFIGWIVAVRKRLYHRWFFYPFVHWYDLLGCIPIAGFRFLRLLRVITIVYRLHRTGVIDLGETRAARVVKKYYGVLMEELTDRVILKMLSDVQQEVRRGGPVFDKVVTEVVRPQKEPLVEWLSHRVRTVAEDNYEQYRARIHRYMEKRINTALRQNKEFARLELIPMLGPQVRRTLENAVSDVVFNVVNGMMQDLASDRNREVLDEAADVTFDAFLLREQDSQLNRMVVDTVDRALEILKQHVRIQEWKLWDLSSDEEDFHRRMREELHRMDPAWRGESVDESENDEPEEDEHAEW
jgi:hypothetical protein